MVLLAHITMAIVSIIFATLTIFQPSKTKYLTSYGKPFIIHTDQGSQYTSKEYLKLMQDLNVKISMSKRVHLGKTDIKSHSMTTSKLT